MTLFSNATVELDWREGGRERECVCVKERERGRERERGSVCVKWRERGERRERRQKHREILGGKEGVHVRV